MNDDLLKGRTAGGRGLPLLGIIIMLLSSVFISGFLAGILSLIWFVGDAT